jgi:hypothetical protein
MDASARAAALERDEDAPTCTRFCWMQCGGCCCIALGVTLIAMGSLTPLIIDSVIDNNARRAVVLESTTEDLEHFELWSTSQPEDAFLSEKFYFFNLTNVDGVMAGDGAALRDIGPYAVRKDKTRQLKRARVRTHRRRSRRLADWLAGSLVPPQDSRTLPVRSRMKSGNTSTGMPVGPGPG